jgi:acetyl-CoA C-acetyltransferase
MMMPMKSVYIVDIVRTPVGKYGGALASVRPDDLAAHAIRELLKRNPSVDIGLIEDVIIGAANQAGEDNRNVARMALLLAGLPVEVAGVTVNRLCASGLQAIMQAAQGIMTGNGDMYIAGGVESMSRAPFVMAKSEEPFARKQELIDTTLGWRFINSKLSRLYHPYSMGETAENVAEKWKVSREEQDAFALQSQVNYQQANQAGKFKEEIVPVPVPKSKDEFFLFEKDEHPRTTTIEKLSSLKPAFKEYGTVTAGNSSGINDGAAACLLVTEDILQKFNLTPLARIVSTGVAGVDPAYMGVGPVLATQKALKRAGLKITDIRLTELNEAFASQSIAIGHPLGCSGVRISATLLYEMRRRNIQYGLATMCIGVGQGAAIIFEKV